MMDKMFSQRGDTVIQPIKKLKGSTMKASVPKDKFIEQLRGPMTYDVMEELGKRNEARVKKLIAEMGTKWIGHPDNHIKRKTEGAVS
jgi:hypothetical protein